MKTRKSGSCRRHSPRRRTRAPALRARDSGPRGSRCEGMSTCLLLADGSGATSPAGAAFYGDLEKRPRRLPAAGGRALLGHRETDCQTGYPVGHVRLGGAPTPGAATGS